VSGSRNISGRRGRSNERTCRLKFLRSALKRTLSSVGMAAWTSVVAAVVKTMEEVDEDAGEFMVSSVARAVMGVAGAGTSVCRIGGNASNPLVSMAAAWWRVESSGTGMLPRHSVAIRASPM
jgi:hypothetical protein